MLLLAASFQVACSVSEDEPIFQPSPPEIRFQGYAAYNSYDAQLCLRNNDKVCTPHLIHAVTAGTALTRVPRHLLVCPYIYSILPARS